MQQHKPHAPGYDEDYFAWTQHQAKLLRTLEELRPERPVGLDLAHLAEEIEGLGSADLNTVKSLIRQVMVHLIKAASDPQARGFAALAVRSDGICCRHSRSIHSIDASAD